MRKFLLATACIALFGHAAQAVNIEWVTIGAPGNAANPDPNTEDCGPNLFSPCGAVDTVYRISRFEVTYAEYAEFLNAVAASDPNELYAPSMAAAITRSGSAGKFKYAVNPGFEGKPVGYVDFYDALRFANWLDNGQPRGDQDASTTEDGAYTITAQGIADNSITRNATAIVFLPNENEWHKAAYYDPAGDKYFDYPASSDAEITCADPGPSANRANCSSTPRGVTDVGAYTGSASPNGTFDQGGNVWEWTEGAAGSFRGVRGGSYTSLPSALAATAGGNAPPTNESDTQGIRLASVEAPIEPETVHRLQLRLRVKTELEGVGAVRDSLTDGDLLQILLGRNPDKTENLALLIDCLDGGARIVALDTDPLGILGTLSGDFNIFDHSVTQLGKAGEVKDVSTVTDISLLPIVGRGGDSVDAGDLRLSAVVKYRDDGVGNDCPDSAKGQVIGTLVATFGETTLEFLVEAGSKVSAGRRDADLRLPLP